MHIQEINELYLETFDDMTPVDIESLVRYLIKEIAKDGEESAMNLLCCIDDIARSEYNEEREGFEDLIEAEERIEYWYIQYGHSSVIYDILGYLNLDENNWIDGIDFSEKEVARYLK